MLLTWLEPHISGCYYIFPGQIEVWIATGIGCRILNYFHVSTNLRYLGLLHVIQRQGKEAWIKTAFNFVAREIEPNAETLMFHELQTKSLKRLKSNLHVSGLRHQSGVFEYQCISKYEENEKTAFGKAEWELSRPCSTKCEGMLGM